MTPTPAPTRRSPRLPVVVQLGVVAVAGVALVLALVATPAALRAAASRREAAPPPSAPGTFRPTDEQWASLGFAAVQPMRFADQVSTSGRIAVDDDSTVQVTPPFSGRVVSVPVVAGQRVAKGQVLATADAAEVAQARSDLTTDQAALTTAKAQAEVATLNAARQQALFKINGAALKDVQQAQSDQTTAQGTLKADASALSLAEARLKLLQAGLGRSGAMAAVRAPISGVVTQRAVGPGQFLNATSNGATTPIFTVSDLSKVWLVADVREEDAARMRVGDPLTATVAGLPGRSFEARADYVGAALDPATRRLTVRATLANPHGLLKPDMFADAAVQVGAADQAMGVPASAVIYEGETARVWVAGPGHALGLRQITTGRTQGGEVEVLGGLQPGDRVVTSGAIFIDRAAKGA